MAFESENPKKLTTQPAGQTPPRWKDLLSIPIIGRKREGPKELKECSRLEINVMPHLCLMTVLIQSSAANLLLAVQPVVCHDWGSHAFGWLLKVKTPKNLLPSPQAKPHRGGRTCFPSQSSPNPITPKWGHWQGYLKVDQNRASWSKWWETGGGKESFRRVARASSK